MKNYDEYIVETKKKQPYTLVQYVLCFNNSTKVPYIFVVGDEVTYFKVEVSSFVNGNIVEIRQTNESQKNQNECTFVVRRTGSKLHVSKAHTFLTYYNYRNIAGNAVNNIALLDLRHKLNVKYTSWEMGLSDWK